ncbi:MAG: hypothetical protein J1F12_08265 [Muribaculaceae bacterium]|nr:hypothetical protein [Muribaculaceae bacterium]
MKILKYSLTLMVLLLGSGMIWAQKVMTPPHVLVVPDLTYCKQNGFIQTFDNMGVIEEIPDYEMALKEDPTLHNALTQIEQLITDRNSSIVIVDLPETINLMKKDAAMSNANAGSEAESVEEAIIRNSEADILVKVYYDLLSQGPRYRVSYTLAGVDAYTGQKFAPVEGMGPNSTDSNPAVLLREAVYQNMDPFLTKLTTYYENMLKNGRMVSFDFKITDSSPYSMSTPLKDGLTLQDVIDDILYDNSVDGGGLERVKSGSTFLQYSGVYIPLITTIRGRQRRQSAKDVAQRVVNELTLYGINADYKVSGLGKVNIFIR